MYLIALQNPGEKYKNTRHNAGAIICGEINNIDTDIKVLYSDVFMNLSGEYVRKIVKQNNINTEKLFVVFDDINIPVGKFIISKGEGASSHNGIKSIKNILMKDDFWRVRIGVGEVSDDKNEKVRKVDGPDMSDFVLSALSDLEIAVIKSLAMSVVEKISLKLAK